MQELVQIDRIEHQFQETLSNSLFQTLLCEKSSQKSDLNAKVEIQLFPSLSTINLQNKIVFIFEVEEIIFM